MNLIIFLTLGICLYVLLFVRGALKYWILALCSATLIYLVIYSDTGSVTIISGSSNISSYEPNGEKRPLRVLAPDAINFDAIYDQLALDTGIVVERITYHDAEDFKKIIESKRQFDITIASDYLCVWLNDIGRTEEIDYKRIHNDKLLSPLITTEDSLRPLLRTSAPYLFNSLGIGYNRYYFDDIPLNWDEIGEVIFSPELKGHVLIHSDMRYVLGLMLSASKFSFNSTDPKEIKIAGDLLIKLMDASLPYLKDEDGIDHFIDESVYIGITTSSELTKSMATNPKLRFVHSAGGSIMILTNFAIAKNATNRSTAYEFIDYMYNPRVAAKVTNQTYVANFIDDSKPFVNPLILNAPSYFFPKFDDSIIREDFSDKQQNLEDTWAVAMKHYEDVVVPRRKIEVYDF
jgi:spermidine/putrescine-binding protein